MKIIHISTSNTGGAGIAAYRLHDALLASPTIDSQFVMQHNYNKGSSDLIHTHTIEPLRTLNFKFRRKFNLTPEILSWKKIQHAPINYEIVSFPETSYRIENHEIVRNADIIHLHWVAGFLNYPTFFKKIKQPIVWTLHDMNPFKGIFHYESDETSNHNLLGAIDRKIMLQRIGYIHQKENIHIVTPSDWLKRKSENSFAFKQYPHYSIANSIDLSAYRFSKEAAKKEINVNNGNPTLMFIAHSVEIPRRGYHLLSDALNLLKDYKDFNIISVGGNKIPLKRDDINHIHYNTTHDHSLLNKIYSASDAMILPTREDNLPNVMLESFANGTPVISFPNGGMAEHISTGINGILIDTISTEALAMGIKDFLDKKYVFDEKTVRNYAERHFSPQLQTEKYIDLYNHILRK